MGQWCRCAKRRCDGPAGRSCASRSAALPATLRRPAQLDDAQGCAVALQTLVAGYHHTLAFVQATEHLNLAGPADAEADFLAQRHKLYLFGQL